VVTTARTMLPTMVAALPYAERVTTPAVMIAEQKIIPLAELLWPRLTTLASAPGTLETLNAALILLADHDIAASTLAARVAASTRANPYAVVSAGLAALDGPLHGGASVLAHTLLAEATTRPDPVSAIADRLRLGTPIPGFGHPLYPDGDPRATTLLGLLDDDEVRDTATRLADAMRTRSGTHPNIDFALAALTLQQGMTADAGEAVFAVARTAGWIAHAREQALSGRLIRPKSRYVGPEPRAAA